MDTRFKRTGIAADSIPAVDRRPVNGFSKGEFAVFAPVKPKAQTMAHALQDAMASVDLSEDPAAFSAEIAGAPATLGELVFRNNEAVWIDANRMRVWEGNPRHVIDPVKLVQLGDSIEAHGQSDPVDVVEDPERPGYYLILGGQRRWLAITNRNLQEGKLLARVRPGIPSQEVMFAAAVTTQVNTDPLEDLDFAITLAKAKDTIGVRALSKVINKSPSEVSKLRSIGDLPSNLMSFLKENAKKFSSLFAYEVMQVCEKNGEVQALEFAKMIVARNLSHKATLTAKDNLLGDRQPLRRSSWSTIRFASGSMRLKEDTGNLTVKLSGLSADGMAMIQEAVKKATEGSEQKT